MADKPLIDASDLKRLAESMEGAPDNVAAALRMAINDVGDKARTKVARALATQSGVPYGTARKALKIKRATNTKPTYDISTSGGYLSLRSFGAVQRKAGVSARPWGKRRIFRGTFIVRSLGGQVFKRVPQRHFRSRKTVTESALGLGGGIDALGGIGSGIGGITRKGRDDIVKLWGPALPKELLSDAVKQVVQSEVRESLAQRLKHHMDRLFPGANWRA